MARPLRNPTTEQPKILAFDEIPQPREFLLHGGIPGVEYLYLLAEEQPKAQSEGWSTIIGMPFFTVKGIGMTLMARGKPMTNTPAQPGTVKCRFYLSDLVAERLGTATLAEPTQLPSAESTPPKFVPPKAIDASLLKSAK